VRTDYECEGCERDGHRRFTNLARPRRRGDRIAVSSARNAANTRRTCQAEESAKMTTAITLQDITIYPVVEQQGPFFDVMEFFPTLTKELLEENRSWLQPTFIDPVSGRLVLC